MRNLPRSQRFVLLGFFIFFLTVIGHTLASSAYAPEAYHLNDHSPSSQELLLRRAAKYTPRQLGQRIWVSGDYTISGVFDAHTIAEQYKGVVFIGSHEQNLLAAQAYDLMEPLDDEQCRAPIKVWRSATDLYAGGGHIGIGGFFWSGWPGVVTIDPVTFNTVPKLAVVGLHEGCHAKGQRSHSRPMRDGLSINQHQKRNVAQLGIPDDFAYAFD